MPKPVAVISLRQQAERRNMSELIERMELYKKNPRIKKYVDKYMEHHRILDVDAALKCMAVKDFIEYVVGGGK